MGTTVTYPNGQVLNTTALTPTSVQALLTTLTCGALGINPPDYSKVRVFWQTQGQPFTPDPAEDVCYVSAVPQDGQYNKVRDRQEVNNAGNTEVIETTTYTKIWNLHYLFYGPSSSLHAQLVWSSTFIDYFTDQLELSNLYPVSDPKEPTRMPEEKNAQWWERADFDLEVYEKVTETLNYTIVQSVEVLISNKDGQVADITVKG